MASRPIPKPIPCPILSHPSGRPFARRRPRHAGAIICTFILGILALAPLLGPFRGGLFQAPRGTDPSESRPRNYHTSYPTGTDSAETGGIAGGGARDNGQSRRAVDGSSQSTTTGRGDDSFLSPEALSRELLSDGRPRCEEDDEGESRCLPTVFFIGVSKCGERVYCVFTVLYTRVFCDFQPLLGGWKSKIIVLKKRRRMSSPKVN